MDRATLKPCPFCGMKVMIYREHPKLGVAIECGRFDCNVMTRYFPTEKLAYEAWKMKTPDEIKNGLACCHINDEDFCECEECPYAVDGFQTKRCDIDMAEDVHAYIQQLEEEKARLGCSIAQLSSTIKHLRDVESRMPNWISVQERLPERWRMDDKDRTLINYLVFIPEYGVDVGNWVKDANMWIVMGLPAKVTHWMPLPEPPKEE